MTSNIVIKAKENKNFTISVIGTTGRDKSRPLTKKHFEFMVDTFSQYLDCLIEEHKIETFTLVSGGAAWADHIAVDYFLKQHSNQICKLKLYLPCLIIEKPSSTPENKLYQFEDKGDGVHWSLNPGRSTNGYHSYFSKQIGRDTIIDIIQAKELGAEIDNSAFGFKNRNSCVAKSDFIIAYTGAVGAAPLGGGTLDTWKKSKSQFKHHITIPENFTLLK